MKKIKNLKKRLGVLLIALCLSVLSVCEVSAQVKFPSNGFAMDSIYTVSYTHLTLPTILRV